MISTRHVRRALRRQKPARTRRPSRLRTSLALAVVGALLATDLACELLNSPPSIEIKLEDETPLTGSTQTFTAVIQDLDEDEVRVTWRADRADDPNLRAGEFSKTRGAEVRWTAPADILEVVVTAIADDRKAGGIDSTQVTLFVVNEAPLITSFTSSESFANLGNSVTLSATAEELDGEEFVFEFFTSPPGVGTMLHESPAVGTATWIAPEDPGMARRYDLIAKVSDIQGFFSTDTLQVLVFSEFGTIWIVDKSQRRVSKYTSRGEEILTSPHLFQNPVAVVNNTNFEFFGCYVADEDAGEIVKLDAKGERVTTITGIANVTDLAIHYGTGSLWAVSVSDDDNDDPRLTVINTATEATIASVRGLRHPSAITINQDRNDVWIADVGGEDRLVRLGITEFMEQAAPPDTLSTSFATVFEGIFNNPESISVLPENTATVYIADMHDDEIERLVHDASTDSYFRGAPVVLAAGTKPAQVAVTSTGLVWVLSLDRSLQFFPEDNTSQRTTIFSYSFAVPHALAVDGATGHVWVGDNGTHQVVEVTDVDSIGISIGGFSFVADLVINK